MLFGRFIRDLPRFTLGRSAVGVLALRVAYVGLSFAIVIVLARLLGTTGFGVYAYGIAWAGFLGVPAALGFERLVVRDLAKYRSEHRWHLARGLIRRSNQIVGVVSVCVALVAIAVGLAFLPTSLAGTFAIAMALVPITALTVLRQASLQGLDRPAVSQLPELLVRPSILVVILGAIWLLHGALIRPGAAMSLNVAVAVVAFVFGAIVLRRSLPDQARLAEARFATRSWAYAALPMMLTSAIWIVNGYVGTIMVGSIVGPSAAGVYAVASRGADLVLLGLLAVNVPLAPRLARLHAAGDLAGIQRVVTQAVVLMLLWAIPAGAILVIFRDVFLGFFGGGFDAGASVLAILVAGQIVNVAAGPVGILLLMTGHERRAALFVGIGTTLNIVLNAALDPFFGVSGAAIAAVASMTFWNVALAIFCAKRLGIQTTVFVRRPRAVRRIQL